MPSAVVTFRFPNGETQFRTTEEPLEPGDVLKSRGDRWIVASVVNAKDGSSVVTLKPEPPLVVPGMPDVTARLNSNH